MLILDTYSGETHLQDHPMPFPHRQGTFFAQLRGTQTTPWILFSANDIFRFIQRYTDIMQSHVIGPLRNLKIQLRCPVDYPHRIYGIDACFCLRSRVGTHTHLGQAERSELLHLLVSLNRTLGSSSFHSGCFTRRNFLHLCPTN